MNGDAGVILFRLSVSWQALQTCLNQEPMAGNRALWPSGGVSAATVLDQGSRPSLLGPVAGKSVPHGHTACQIQPSAKTYLSQPSSAWAETTR